jgi:hypothetical protein
VWVAGVAAVVVCWGFCRIVIQCVSWRVIRQQHAESLVRQLWVMGLKQDAVSWGSKWSLMASFRVVRSSSMVGSW